MLRKSKDKKVSPNHVSTVIGQGTEIQGDIIFSGGLHVDGKVTGNIRAEGDSEAVISLSENGKIEGEVKSPIIFLNGAVEGNVFATKKIEMAEKSKVIGDVTYTLLEMEVGAEVNGRLVRKMDSQESKTVENISPIHLDKSKGNGNGNGSGERVKEAKIS